MVSALLKDQLRHVYYHSDVYLDKMCSKLTLPMYFLKKGILMFGFRDQYFVTFGFLINPITMT